MSTQPTLQPPGFFRDKGCELRELLCRQPSLNADAQRIFLAGALRDVMGSDNQILAPLEQAIQRLSPQPSATPDPTPRATLTALHQHLSLMYNAAAVDAALAFAEGYLGLKAGFVAAPSADASWPAEVNPSPGPAAATSLVSPVPAIGQPRRLAALIISLLLLTVLASLGVITLLLLRQGLPWRQASGGRADSSASLSVKSDPVAKPAGTPADPLPAAPQPLSQRPDSSLLEMGTASAGQLVRLDLSSITTTGNPSLRHFRYQLGGQWIESVADCASGTWTTYPEGQSHSPQSSATARMLARVCQSAGSVAAPVASPPAVSGAGAAIVFDPPSNIRSSPNGAILCSVTSRGAIPIRGQEGDWYLTDFCGTTGYIHRGQVRF